MKGFSLMLAGMAAIGTMGLSSCGNGGDASTVAGGGKPKDFKFINRANMDTTVKAGDNFFEYANGTWLKNTPIPGDQTRWGSFNILIEETRAKLDTIMTDVAKEKDLTKGSNKQLVADFFKSGMDTAAIEKAGLKPMEPLLNKIKALSSTQDLMKEIAREQTMGLGGVFGFYVAPDDKNITNEICQFFQGGLGLSPKDAYFAKDERSEKNRQAYIKYVGDMLVQMGEVDADARKNAQAIFNLEKSLAGASLSPVEMRNPQKLYNKYAVADINKLAPSLNWATLLTDLKAKDQDSVIVGTPEFFKELSQQLTATPLAVWKQYLAFHAVSDMSAYLSKNFSDLHFDFYGKTIYGQKEQKPRWQRVIRVIDGGVGDALGQLYVKRYFPANAKKRMDDLVNNLQDAFANRIKNLDWMSDVTKQKALAKLNAFTKKIGYPDKWKNYEGLAIIPNNYVQNVINATEFAYNFEMNKLGKPVDKTEWGMTPPTINAYYNPGFNEIVFPAGILQFPFFDFNADDAVNYGGIGAVIGHEMTHGFDDQGSQYDAQGYLKNWWTPEDSAKFAAKTNVVREQFNKYFVADSTPVNGSLTLGENLADLGGLTIAYDAFKKTKEGQSDTLIDGFTPDQRFFLSWAQVWRSKATPEAIIKQVQTDPHSPGIFRCNGPLSNFAAFYKAFNVQKGDKMWRPEEERAKVW